MSEVKITKETAKKLYVSVPDFFKKQLEAAFGKDAFRKIDYEDIKTFEDACEALVINPNAVWNNNDTADEAAYKKLKVIIRAINQSWIPDWNNTSQRKWFPWFHISSGFGFGGSDCGFGRSHSHVGSRLCFESKEKSDYAGRQFTAIYEEFLK
jgi:hypothetical protein